MEQKLFALAVVALLGLLLRADPLSDWLASMPSDIKHPPRNGITIGGEEISWDDDGRLDYY